MFVHMTETLLQTKGPCFPSLAATARLKTRNPYEPHVAHTAPIALQAEACKCDMPNMAVCKKRKAKSRTRKREKAIHQSQYLTSDAPFPPHTKLRARPGDPKSKIRTAMLNNFVFGGGGGKCLKLEMRGVERLLCAVAALARHGPSWIDSW